MNCPDKRTDVVSEPDRAQQGRKYHLRNDDDSASMIIAQANQHILYEIEVIETVELKTEKRRDRQKASCCSLRRETPDAGPDMPDRSDLVPCPRF